MRQQVYDYRSHSNTNIDTEKAESEEVKTETTKTAKANTESVILLWRTIVISVMDVGREDGSTDC